MQAYEQAATAYQSALGSFGGGDESYVIAQPKKLEVRTYTLPKGKLEALTKLMIREDVPVLVSPGEDKIEVHGTHDQHMIFEAFCAMIRGKEGQKAFQLPEGRLELMSGICERRFWAPDARPSDFSAQSAEKAVARSGIQRRQFGALVRP